MIRRSLKVTGRVQGVGFRPFTLRLARELGLTGWVRNDRGGVSIEVQGAAAVVELFVERVRSVPPPARVQRIEQHEAVVQDETRFLIGESSDRVEVSPSLPADLATCAACLVEVSTPGERRYRYPFTNCTACGPRVTIVARLPYDRSNTSMARFPLCAACRREYEDVGDRRYHAEPIACPDCGPRLTSFDSRGAIVVSHDHAIEHAVAALNEGRVVAVRGLGGFQLLVDATNDGAIGRLRERKRRPHKPFAVMLADSTAVLECCDASSEALELLASPAAPIMLLPRKPSALAPSIAPLSPELGVLLPTTPLHHLLLRSFGRPLVCTSGNLVDEPICVGNDEARSRLAGVADVFLLHDRAVLRPMDDSLARMTSAGPEILRRARGFACEPVAELDRASSILALGAHYKSSVTLVHGTACVMSQHLGDLDTKEGVDLLRRTADDLCEFYAVRPALIACDEHPDYASSALAAELAARYDARVLSVQHHHAHIAAVVASHGFAGPVAGLAWDGTGYGGDGTIWGGELLRLEGEAYVRLGHLQKFRLPGGDRAGREPWRAALGVLHACRFDHALNIPAPALRIARQSIDSGMNAPWCSSMGRLFDAVAFLILGTSHSSFEGQAAMQLEAVARTAESDGAYPMPLVVHDGVATTDLRALVEALLEDHRRGTDAGKMARRFHEAIVEFGVGQANFAEREQVALGGGCFQNLILRERLSERLMQTGFRVLVARSVPVNDGGISLGQAWVAARRASSAS